MDKQLKKERQQYWDKWFKSCVEDGTCAIQNLIYNRDKEFIDRAAGRSQFYMYAELGRGDSGNKGFMLKGRMKS